MAGRTIAADRFFSKKGLRAAAFFTAGLYAETDLGHK